MNSFIKLELINTSVDYIKNSIAIFGDRRISLRQAFIALCYWIADHSECNALELRLIEEFTEMKEMCTTGHIARLMNVIQGFTEDENLCIRISGNDQCVAVVKSYLTKSLEECKDDEILDGLLTGSEKYKEFLREKISEKLLEWSKSYGKEMLDRIATTVNLFAGVKVFN